MVLRCKTLSFHIFEKNENWKKFENTSLTINNQINSH